MTLIEIEIQIRAEKIRLEHEALMQEMNIILVSMVGFPLAWVSAVNYLGLTAQIGNPLAVFVFASILAIVELARELKKDELDEKTGEIDRLLSDFAA